MDGNIERMETTMPIADVYRETQERQEDEFINIAEQGIKSGMDFSEAFRNRLEYSMHPSWKERYTQMENSYTSLSSHRQRDAWNADEYRQAVKDRRQTDRLKESEERFYKSNEFWLKEHVKAGHIFEQTDYPEHMRPLFQRAEMEVLGYNKPDKEKPLLDPFATGFQSE